MRRKSISFVMALIIALSFMIPTIFAAPKSDSQIVTANLYLPGEYNKKIFGLTAYLNNPDNPLEATGMPNKPFEKNATLNTSDMILTLKLPNPVFTLQKLGTAKNAKVVSIKTSDEMKGLGPKKVIHDSRISEVTIKLLDKSGEYIFEGSTVYPTMFSKDISNVPLYLKVEFNKEPVTEKATLPILKDEPKEDETANNKIEETEKSIDVSQAETQESALDIAENINDVETEIEIEIEIESNVTNESTKNSNTNTVIIILCVISIVAVAAIVIFVIYKKKKV